MKESIKKILRNIGLYHSLQSSYRTGIVFFKKLFYRLRFAKYKGKGYTCNVCGSQYEKFIDEYPQATNSDALSKYSVIAGYGKNILCPFCLSTARERLVIAMLQQSDLKDKEIFHVAPEKKVSDLLKSKAKVTTADLIPGFYQIKGIIKADITNLDFPGNQFDMVIANHVMEHIPDDSAAMSELFRVLKPGGNAILQIPYSQNLLHTIETPQINDPVLQEKLYGQKDHVRIYALHDYIVKLEETGYDVLNVSYADLQPFYKYAIQQNESFLRITKPMA
ncbi:MAG: class I SAM-dependent methyltransferase [Ferruginibacter sp.]